MRRGWTIVELLIVLAVAALLTSLLLPALSSARSAGRSTLCQTNLRQMAVAAQTYANLHAHWPMAIRYESSGGVMKNVAWDWVTTFSGQIISPGAIWNFTDNPDRVMQCPDYHDHSNTTGDPFTGYNYNTTYIGGEMYLGSGLIRRGLRPTQCRRAASCAMFGCGGFAGGANKLMRAPLNSESTSLGVIYAGGQAFRHKRTTNVAYLDGHVGSVQRPWEGVHATSQLLNQTMRFPRNGFLSHDDAAYDPR